MRSGGLGMNERINTAKHSLKLHFVVLQGYATRRASGLMGSKFVSFSSSTSEQWNCNYNFLNCRAHGWLDDSYIMRKLFRLNEHNFIKICTHYLAIQFVYIWTIYVKTIDKYYTRFSIKFYEKKKKRKKRITKHIRVVVKFLWHTDKM